MTDKHKDGGAACDWPDDGAMFLLEWLSREDYSQYGECRGAALNTLLAKGLAQIHEPGTHQSGFIAQGTTPDHCAVSLTDAGRALLTERDKR